MMWICRIFLLVGFSMRVVYSTTCPHNVNSRIQECVQPVAEYAKVLNNQDTRNGGNEFGSAFSLPNMGGRVFNDLCRLIAKFNSCVRDYRSTCPRHVTTSLIDSSYGYLCNEGYNTFMESAECLMELDRKPAVKRCHDETLKEIESANTESGISMSAKLDRMCGALNFFSGCVRSPIKQECGISAWQVIYRVLKDTTNTLMPACQFTGTSQKLAMFQKQQELEEAEAELTTSTALMTTSRRPPTTKIMRTSVVPIVEIVAYTSTLAPKHSVIRNSAEELADSSHTINYNILFIILVILRIFN